MVSVGSLIRFEGKPSRVQDVERMPTSAVDHIREEGVAVGWFALRLSPASFAIFDAFADEAGRNASISARADRAALISVTVTSLRTSPEAARVSYARSVS